MTARHGLEKQRRELMPSNYAKKIIIEFCEQWLRDNSAYGLPTDGAPDPEPNLVTPEGAPLVRSGDHPIYVRDSFGTNDRADLKTGIVVQRKSFGWSGRGIGQKLHFVRQLDPDDKILQGQEFTDEIEIPVVAWCLSENGIEADDMACMLGFALHAARSILPGSYQGLRDILDIHVGEETPVRDPTTKQELMGVPVSVRLTFQYFWRIFDLRGSTMKAATIQVQGDETVKLSITAERI